MYQRDPTACIGITPTALTVTVDGKPVLVIPRERMLDLMVRIGIALRKAPGCGGSLPPQGL
ncbi:hypothetical protein [Paracoccus niistensis]|uniref:(2Fe-2S)-binding protein n=1 Tax=Paracoccus niistensis TaxID=632935 RepID=A0ABV6HZD8_9RHOB